MDNGPYGPNVVETMPVVEHVLDSLCHQGGAKLYDNYIDKVRKPYFKRALKQQMGFVCDSYKYKG